MNKKGLIEKVIGICILFSLVFGGMQYFATAKEHNTLALRVDEKIKADRADRIQERMWALEDRNGGKGNFVNWSQADKDEYRKLKAELDKLRK